MLSVFKPQPLLETSALSYAEFTLAAEAAAAAEKKKQSAKTSSKAGSNKKKESAVANTEVKVEEVTKAADDSTKKSQ